MVDASKKVAREIIQLIEGRDLNVAAGIVSDDDTLDELHATSYHLMLEDGYKATPQEILNIALVSRYFERFGDHAVGISRRIVYLVTGDHTGERALI
jgi:phosphate transport system protein